MKIQQSSTSATMTLSRTTYNNSITDNNTKNNRKKASCYHPHKKDKHKMRLDICKEAQNRSRAFTEK